MTATTRRTLVIGTSLLGPLVALATVVPVLLRTRRRSIATRQGLSSSFSARITGQPRSRRSRPAR